MLNEPSIESRIKELIVRILNLQIDAEEIEDKELIFDGILGFDSVATLELVVALEEEFGITIEDEDLSVELFESVNTLADYVKKQIGRETLSYITSQ